MPKPITLLLVGLLSGLFHHTLSAQFNFTDVTTAASLDYFGESWGSAWGDLNADGRPDLFVGNHKREGHPESDNPTVYVNLGSGSFKKRQLTGGNDVHGAAWIDLDNNGIQDLILTTGRSQTDIIIYNKTEGVVLDIRAFSNKIGDGHLGRSRAVAATDVNNDGKLDIIIPRSNGFDSTQFGTSLYFNIGYKFKDVTVPAGFDQTESCNLVTFMDVDADRNQEILLSVKKKTLVSYETSVIPMTSEIIMNNGIISDVVIGDYDGDLASDLVVLFLKSRPAMGTINDSTLSAIIYPDASEEGIEFKADLPLHLDIRHGRKEVYDVAFGDTAGLMDANYDDYKFETILTSYPHGMRTHVGGVDKGVFIGYDSVTQLWTVLYSDPVPTLGFAVRATSLSGNPVELIAALGFDPNPELEADWFFFNDGFGTFSDVTPSIGYDTRTGARSGVSGDFDNDMDVDIYLQCAYGIPNFENILLENDGSGNFSIVPFAGGAPGSDIGIGDVVTSVDYDNNGFLDLFLTNGATSLIEGGPNQLYKNMGNSNHYLAVQLEGTTSNRDALGASMILYAGGVAQLREQNGGAHRFSQNHNRLHFGLGSNTFADSAVIYWPSGMVQHMGGPIPADQIRQIIEPVVLGSAMGEAKRVDLSNSSSSLLAQPNPSSSNVQVFGSLQLGQEYTILLSNLIGQQLRTDRFVDGMELDLSLYPQGNYFLSLINSAGEIIGSTTLILK